MHTVRMLHVISLYGSLNNIYGQIIIIIIIIRHYRSRAGLTQTLNNVSVKGKVKLPL